EPNSNDEKYGDHKVRIEFDHSFHNSGGFCHRCGSSDRGVFYQCDQGVANGRDSASKCLWEENQARCGKETQSDGAGCFGLAYRDSIYPGPYCFSKKRCMIDREGNSSEDKEIHFKVREHIDLQLAPEH